jgi:hypothetical protein
MREELKHKRCHEMKQIMNIVNYRNETNKHKWPLIHSKKKKKEKKKFPLSLRKAVEINIRARLYNMYLKTA